MRQSRPQSPSDVANSKRIDRLAAAFSAFRRAHGPGRKIPLGLRRQYLAALDAGGAATAIGRACGVSWTQTRSWRAAAGAGSAVTPPPQVLSVVGNQFIDGSRENTGSATARNAAAAPIRRPSRRPRRPDLRTTTRRGCLEACGSSSEISPVRPCGTSAPVHLGRIRRGYHRPSLRPVSRRLPSRHRLSC